MRPAAVRERIWRQRIPCHHLLHTRQVALDDRHGRRRGWAGSCFRDALWRQAPMPAVRAGERG